jgi:hypothetical protein
MPRFGFLRSNGGSSKAKKTRAASYRAAEQEVYPKAAKEMALRIGANDKPVLVGPWLGDVNSELLYWTPFLRWLLGWGNIDSSRVWVLSRDGVRRWYAGVGDHYLELNDLAETPELGMSAGGRLEENSRYTPDPNDLPRSDLEILQKVMAETGLDDVELVHPSHMFHIFKPYRRGRSPISYAEHLTKYAPLRSGADDDPGLGLPANYVAIVFHASASFPLNKSNAAFVEDIVGRLSQNTDVVVLDPRQLLSDAQLIDIKGSYRVHIPAAPDLGVHTRILSRARMLVGTYGGFSYLGALLGINTIGLYSTEAFSLQDLALAQAVFRGEAYGNLSVMHAGLVDSLFDVLEPSISSADRAGGFQ